MDKMSSNTVSVTNNYGNITAQTNVTVNGNNNNIEVKNGLIALPEQILHRTRKDTVAEENVVAHLRYLPYLHPKYAEMKTTGSTPANTQEAREHLAERLGNIWSTIMGLGLDCLKREVAQRFNTYVKQRMPHDKKWNRENTYKDAKDFVFDTTSAEAAQRIEEDVFFNQRLTYHLVNLPTMRGSRFLNETLFNAIQDYLSGIGCYISNHRPSSKNESHSFVQIAVLGCQEVKRQFRNNDEGLFISKVKRAPKNDSEVEEEEEKKTHYMVRVDFDPGRKVYLQAEIGKIEGLESCVSTPDQTKLGEMLKASKSKKEGGNLSLEQMVDRFVLDVMKSYPVVDENSLCGMISDSFQKSKRRKRDDENDSDDEEKFDEFLDEAMAMIESPDRSSEWLRRPQDSHATPYQGQMYAQSQAQQYPQPQQQYLPPEQQAQMQAPDRQQQGKQYPQPQQQYLPPQQQYQYPPTLSTQTQFASHHQSLQVRPHSQYPPMQTQFNQHYPQSQQTTDTSLTNPQPQQTTDTSLNGLTNPRPQQTTDTSLNGLTNPRPQQTTDTSSVLDHFIPTMKDGSNAVPPHQNSKSDQQENEDEDEARMMNNPNTGIVKKIISHKFFKEDILCLFFECEWEGKDPNTGKPWLPSFSPHDEVVKVQDKFEEYFNNLTNEEKEKIEECMKDPKKYRRKLIRQQKKAVKTNCKEKQTRNVDTKKSNNRKRKQTTKVDTKTDAKAERATSTSKKQQTKKVVTKNDAKKPKELPKQLPKHAPQLENFYLCKSCSRAAICSTCHLEKCNKPLNRDGQSQEDNRSSTRVKRRKFSNTTALADIDCEGLNHVQFKECTDWDYFSLKWRKGKTDLVEEFCCKCERCFLWGK